MQGQWNHGHAHCRCRFPDEYALAKRVEHPLNVYLREREALPPLDELPMLAFAPHRPAESSPRPIARSLGTARRWTREQTP